MVRFHFITKSRTVQQEQRKRFAVFFCGRHVLSCRELCSGKNLLTIFALLLFFLTFSALPLPAQEQKKKSLRLAPIYIDLSQTKQAQEERKPEKVLIDRSNLIVLDKVAPQQVKKKRLSKTLLHKMERWTKYPADSLAGDLAKSVVNKQIIWTPFSGSHYPGGTSILTAALSPDKSVIAFLERIGKTPGPYGTRIVLYDTHQWQILRAEDLENIYAVQCAWTDKNILVILAAGQKSRHTKTALHFYDTLQGKVLSEYFLNFPPGKSFISAGKNHLLLTEKDTDKLYLYRYESGSSILQTKKILKDFAAEPLLAAGNDKENFHTFDGKYIRLHSLSTGKSQKKYPIPSLENFFRIRSFMPLPNDDFLLIPSYSSGTPARYLKNNSLLAVGTASSGLAMQGYPASAFTVGFSKAGEFAVYQLPALKRIAYFSANNVKPKTQGTPLYAFAIPHAKAFAVMDSRGIFYLLYPDRANRRYLKEILTKELH